MWFGLLTVSKAPLIMSSSSFKMVSQNLNPRFSKTLSLEYGLKIKPGGLSNILNCLLDLSLYF